MEHFADVLVIGGGVIGLTTAFYLSREGVRVALVERGDLGREASWAGAGILPPGNSAAARTPFDQLRGLSCEHFPALSAELLERTGIDNGYRRSGGLEILLDPPQSSDEWHGAGVASQLLDTPQARQLEPSLSASFTGKALFLPDMAQVRNPRHLQALVVACQELGVKLAPGCAVQNLVVEGSRVRGIQTAAGIVEAGQIVVATGAWTDPLLEPLGFRPGIRPVRGQIALLQPGNIVRHILVKGSQYLVPRDDGRLLVGSTEEDVGFDKRTTATAIHDLLQLAISLVPELANAPLERAWAGLRPGSPDGLPFIGPVPGVANLFVAAGHFRAGIQLSPGTGILLKDLVLGRRSSISMDPFRLERGTQGV